MTLESIQKQAERMAVETGKYLAKHFSNLHQKEVHQKARYDLVTDIDRGANRRLVAALRKAFPEHGIQSEEGLNRPSKSGHTWLIDPLDGTGNFVAHIPEYAVSLALMVNGMPILGVVYAPETKQLFSAVIGKGARCNSKRLRVSTKKNLKKAVVAVSNGYDRPTKPRGADIVKKLKPRVELVRHSGSVALDLVSVGAGWTDAAVKCGPIKPWDVAAGIVIAREAGAEVSDLHNRVFNFGSPNLLVSNQVLHHDLLQVFKKP